MRSTDVDKLNFDRLPKEELRLYQATYSYFVGLMESSKAIRNHLEDPKTPNQDRVDALAVLKKTQDFLEELRKELAGIIRHGEAVTCAVWVDEGTGNTVYGQLCSATPRVKVGIKIPKREADPEAFDELMKLLGVSEETGVRELVRPHWPALMEYVQELQAEGKPIPASLKADREYHQYAVTCRVSTQTDLNAIAASLQD